MGKFNLLSKSRTVGWCNRDEGDQWANKLVHPIKESDTRQE